MIRRAIALSVVSLGLVVGSAAAWDPDEDGEWWWWEPEPVPAWSPEPVGSWAPDPDTSWSPDPAPASNPPEPPAAEAPAGLYYVTETYVADVVTHEGPVTSYSTATVVESPGTYARVLETVDTGASSGLDGSAFNGRAQMTDGRSVAGTYYENFILTAAGFASVSIVFFQDDSETARISTSPASPTPGAVVPPEPAAPTAIAPSAPAITVAPPTGGAPPAAAPPAAAAPSLPAPTVGRGPERIDVETGSRAMPAPETAPIPAGSGPVAPGGPPRLPVLRGGVSPQPQGDLLSTIDVLRGRRIVLWSRATVDGAPARVREWNASGEFVALGPLSGTGEEPLVARWDTLARPGVGWPVRLALVVDLPGGGATAIDVVVSVLVRSPALVQ